VTARAPLDRSGRAGIRLLGRLGGMALVVWGAASVGFVALRLIPGDPFDVMLGVHAEVSEQVRDRIRAEWGLSQPPLLQYFGYLSRLVRGDLGTSYRMQQPVADVIGAQLAPTVQLMSLAIAFALVLALGSALLARGPRSKGILSFLELFAVSSPTFWTGLVLIAVFGFTLRWFPVAATDGFAALILPAVTLAIPVAGIISQVLRQGLDAAAALPFVETVRSRGVGHTRLLFHHTLRHAAADSITLTGYIIGSLLGGSVLVETVFARPGLGRVALNAILNRDIPVVLGIVVVAAVVFSVINFVVDLLYDRIDPRLASEPAYS
jgi:peptide/nickel transport system permease protein